MLETLDHSRIFSNNINFCKFQKSIKILNSILERVATFQIAPYLHPLLRISYRLAWRFRSSWEHP